MEMGIIGNCQYNALVDTSGNIAWLCWPRLDSSFVFGSLLDDKAAGRFRIGPPDGRAGSQEYLHNTNVLKTTFQSNDGSFEVIDFAPRFHLYHRYYKPNMLIRIIRPVSGSPVASVELKPVYDYGRIQCGTVFGSNHIRYTGPPLQLRLTSNLSLNWIHESREFAVDRTYYMVLTYGEPLEDRLGPTCERFLENTVQYWRNWCKHTHLPLDYQKEILRAALVLKLHQFEDTGAIIAATTTSIPEAAGTERNWDYRFCWLRDALFSLLALRRLSHFEELEKFVNYLRNVAETMDRTNDRLQPVYGISGEYRLTEHILDHLDGYRGNKPVRIGNQAHEHLQHDVYGEVIMVISQIFLDQRFMGETSHYPVRLLQRLMDKVELYLEANDAGLWEFRGIAQLHTFTVLMHWAGAALGQQVSSVHNYKNLHQQSRELRLRAERILNEQCWNEEVGAFTQAAGGKALDAAMLMMVNMGFLRPNDPRAKRHVAAIAKNLCTENGYLHRYVIKDDFGDTHNAFLICSFWLAEAHARLGNKREALELFDKLLSRSNHLGLYSEDIDPLTGELWGNFPQTYSHVGLINAAFALSRRNSDLGYFSPFDIQN
ncbi:MAG: glycoside hydrolase family 15 protein [Acidobacteriota bacterium]|nr:glycoside hydrolase family 15 protein [Acidobacteriota bacterium]